MICPVLESTPGNVARTGSYKNPIGGPLIVIGTTIIGIMIGTEITDGEEVGTDQTRHADGMTIQEAQAQRETSAVAVTDIVPETKMTRTSTEDSIDPVSG